MMHTLERGEMERILPLVPRARDAGHMAFVHAVIEGRQPGHAFVDDTHAPRSALVFNHAGFAFALGRSRPDLVVPIFMALIDDPSIENQPTALWCTAPSWADALRPYFHEERSRDEFHFDAARAPIAVELAPGYRLQSMDEVLASRWGEGLDAWVVRIWGGPKQFAERAFGIAVLQGDDLVADCTVCAIGGPRPEREAEIEIGTAPAHRRKGLALGAAVAFFEQCRSRGLTPAWTCDSLNTASRRLAEQLGFT